MRKLLTWCFFLLAVLMINDGLLISTIKKSHEVSKILVEQFSDIEAEGSSSDELQDIEEEGFAFLLQPPLQDQFFHLLAIELVIPTKDHSYQDISLDMVSPPPQGLV
ncbi:hypothetical protein [Aquirufa rosea]|uniref:Uncharacterized protein n=1 Tax=Aquirufa rosea TaxID=2509241 RepID=A0A4Q1C184_9BACT|nr:hypothetical protein [Aquirufa rosea]RXK50913.1 hypothetical protein ESB04_04475 [Aquirufa rosea]